MDPVTVRFDLDSETLAHGRSLPVRAEVGVRAAKRHRRRRFAKALPLTIALAFAPNGFVLFLTLLWPDLDVREFGPFLAFVAGPALAVLVLVRAVQVTTTMTEWIEASARQARRMAGPAVTGPMTLTLDDAGITLESEWHRCVFPWKSVYWAIQVERAAVIRVVGDALLIIPRAALDDAQGFCDVVNEATPEAAVRLRLRSLLKGNDLPCPSCGYSLRDNASLKCPECGLDIAWDALDDAATA